MNKVNKTMIGQVYYASKDAQRKRYYFEGRAIGTNNYHSVHYLNDGFVEINLDDSGTNYIHLALYKELMTA
jgi:hypothetical protein